MNVSPRTVLWAKVSSDHGTKVDHPVDHANVPITVAAQGRTFVPALTDRRSLTNPTIRGIAPNGPSSMVPHRTTPANSQPSAGSTHRDFSRYQWSLVRLWCSRRFADCRQEDLL